MPVRSLWLRNGAVFLMLLPYMQIFFSALLFFSWFAQLAT